MSRDRVLAAAIALADSAGIESLTMRRLAQELGVEAMTLYYYVARKADILDGIVDMVVSEIELPSGGDWKAAIRRSAISAYEAHVGHPWSAGLVLSRPRLGGARLRYMDSILECLRTAGFSAEMTHHAYHALDSHIMGFTLWVVGIEAGMADAEFSGAAFLEQLDRDAYPHLAEHGDHHLRERDPRDPDDEGEFAFGLDLILDGLERLRQTA